MTADIVLALALASLVLAAAAPPGRDLGLEPAEVPQVALGDLDPLLGRVVAQSAATAPRGDRHVRVDVFDGRSRRTGYVVVDPQTGRFDRYDSLSRHTGTGTITPPPASGGVPPSLRIDERRLGR